MKMAKAKPEEFERVRNFINPLEDLFDGRSWFSNEEDWVDWDDDNEDKKELLAIKKELKEFGDDEDNRLILYEFIKRRFRKANYSGSIDRIIMDAEVLIENACDPDLDYLEYKPEIMNAEINTITKIEEWIKNNVDNTNNEVKKILEYFNTIKEDTNNN